ncbi:MAG: hypothetical protein EXR69_10575 [Myxococcales bacterium]|nr:hypothetical protein [Myxococcales bacterium]
MEPHPRATQSLIPRASLAVALSGLAAGGAALCVCLWPTSAGVALADGETLSVAAGVAVAVGGISLMLNVARVPAAAAAILPLAGLQATYWLPLSGRLRPRIDHTAVYMLVVALVGLALALRGRPQRRPAAILAAATLAIGTLASALLQHPRVDRVAPPSRPPIVLLTLDTLRADHLAGFGGQLATAHTPNLDALFTSSRVYRNAFASMALTQPSHTTMLTGLGVEQHRVTVNGQAMPAALPWAPEELQAAGWQTRAVVSASVLDASLGLARGFDSFDSTFEDRPGRAFAFLNWSGFRSHAGSTENRSGAATLALVPGFPEGSFTWIHLYDAHWPYAPSAEAGAAVGLSDVTPLPESGVGRQMNPSQKVWPAAQVARGKLLYRASLQDLDALVGSLLDRLPADASIIVAGDHGESLDEHDYVFSHGRLPFAPDVHTPLAVRSPGLTPGWVDTPVSLAQIAPTLRTLAGLPGSTDRGLLGPIAASPVLSIAYADGFFGAQKPHPLGPIAGVALREPGRSAAWTRWTDPASYDPLTDPRELLPLPIGAGDHAALEQAAAAAGQAEAPEPELRGALEALGYLEPAAGFPVE